MAFIPIRRTASGMQGLSIIGNAGQLKLLDFLQSCAISSKSQIHGRRPLHGGNEHLVQQGQHVLDVFS